MRHSYLFRAYGPVTADGMVRRSLKSPLYGSMQQDPKRQGRCHIGAKKKPLCAFSEHNSARTLWSSTTSLPGSPSFDSTEGSTSPPILTIKRIASKQARCSSGGGPPFNLGGRGGINGLISFHCSPVRIGFRSLIGAPRISFSREIYKRVQCILFVVISLG